MTIKFAKYYLKLIYLVSVCHWINGDDLFEKLNSTQSQVFEINLNSTGQISDNYTGKYDEKYTSIPAAACRLASTDPYMANRIKELLSLDVKLLEFNLLFDNYTTNPLAHNTSWTYLGTKWSRAYSQHGQTLLSLAFNYGMMSLMTLTLGVMNMDVPLVDEPAGCVWRLSEEEKTSAVLYLLMRDFQHTEPEVTLQDQERICHEIVVLDGPEAGDFKDRCCFIDPITRKLKCTTDIINIWLRLLLLALASVKFCLLLFGPVLFIKLIERVSREEFPYKVELRDPLIRKVFLCDSTSCVYRTYRSAIDLRGKKSVPEFAKSLVKDVAIGEPIEVQFKRFDIRVNHSKLLVENYVPVSLFTQLYETLFECRIRTLGPFVRCCRTNILRAIYVVDKEIEWLFIFKIIAKCFTVLLAPFPFYIRLYIYYYFEEEEILNRQNHLHRYKLERSYDGSLLVYLSPLHPFFIAIYVTYFLTALVIHGFLPRKMSHSIISIVIETFRDLKYLRYVDILDLLVGNFIWPFTRYGILGVLLAPFYWLLAVPLTLLVCTYYIVPSLYVVGDMILRVIYKYKKKHPGGRYKVVKLRDQSMFVFKIENIIRRKDNSVFGSKDATETSRVVRSDLIKFVCKFAVILLCICNMIGVFFVLAEVVSLVIEVGVFTMMGVIVNAGAMLRYTTLLILVVIYSYDTYNNVTKKYLKLNKALFSEVKNRCKNIDVVTSMPSHLQENHGFKSQELSEQADYEESDDVARNVTFHWMINDLVLFMDNEDMPRIPKKLFEEVCQIRVAGAPGPVYESMIDATKDFLKIIIFIFFVFVVVLTFGEVYQVSSTNQMLATLAGGFLPFIMRTFMSPSAPDIELGTVSFKSKLDEIIKQFRQNWPIYDLPFELYKADEEAAKLEAMEEAAKARPAPAPVKQNSVHAQEQEYNITADNVEDEYLLNYAMPAFVPDPTPVATATAAPNRAQHKPSTSVVVPSLSRITSFSLPGDNKDNNDYDVDILIYLPTAPHMEDERWLEEWSHFNSVKDGENEV